MSPAEWYETPPTSEEKLDAAKQPCTTCGHIGLFHQFSVCVAGADCLCPGLTV